jgi:hypothetical protein
MQESIQAELLAEQPKIDAAIKSFASYLVSGMPMATSSPTQARHSLNDNLDDDAAVAVQVIMNDLGEVLSVSRRFSKLINQHIAPIRKSDLNDTRREATVVTWNYLVASNQKPTKLLGRNTLRLLWSSLKCEFTEQPCDDVGLEKTTYYLDLFERLLLDESSHDFQLIWSADGGQSELRRRASDRKHRATQQATISITADQDNGLAVIDEEIPLQQGKSEM